MNTKTTYITIALFSILSLSNSWARKPIVPDQATMDKVHQEISRTVQAKEYSSTVDLSLYSCYGKIYFEDNTVAITNHVKQELEDSGVAVERLKVNQKTNQSYLIISMITHDTQELKNFIAEMFSSEAHNTSMSKTLLRAGRLVARNLGCTELPLR